MPIDPRRREEIAATVAAWNQAHSAALLPRNTVRLLAAMFPSGEVCQRSLADIAKRGGGRYYQVKRVEDVPKIFLQETVIVAGRDIVEGKFAPAVALQAPVVRGLDGLPALYGYNSTEIKAAARAILVTPNGKPVLAQWQYGLGRAVAWTSDLKGQWGRDWVGWGAASPWSSSPTGCTAAPVSTSAACPPKRWCTRPRRVVAPMTRAAGTPTRLARWTP